MLKLELDDSRRLTGKGLLWDLPGAVIDAFVAGVDKDKVVRCWQKHVTLLLEGVGWQQQQTTYRIFEDGVTVAISAPLDALYAATRINESAWTLTVDELNGHVQAPDEATLVGLKQAIDAEVNPPLLELISLAEQHQVPWLSDDDAFSLGFGATVETWAVNALPTATSIDWQKYQSVAVAMITGTNGKSTSVRLTAEMFKQAGRCCGVTSTDFIRVGDDIIDTGDYSGPGGARMLLRDNRVEVALLEVARGGILRRGLPIPQVDAALITNVAEDHLGQYGINTLQGLTATKFVVAKAVSEQGTLVLNADDSEVVSYGAGLKQRKCWFALERNHPVLVAQANSGGAICYVANAMMVYQDSSGVQPIVAVNAVPMTLAGAAKHNVQNALGAIGLAKTLRVGNEAIKVALTTFQSDASDNPGRGNVYQVNGARVIMDFAHNEHSMKAMVDTVKNLAARRKWLMLSAPGDRSDQDIKVMTQAALEMAPDGMVVAELEEYLRGRPKGEIPALMRQVVEQFSDKAVDFQVSQTPLEGVKLILGQLQPGDLALLLVLSDRAQVTACVEGYSLSA